MVKDAFVHSSDTAYITTTRQKRVILCCWADLQGWAKRAGPRDWAVDTIKLTSATDGLKGARCWSRDYLRLCVRAST